MEENKNKNLLKKLLDRLQEDSWQLELLVSGFTLFGLFSARGPVQDIFQKSIIDGDMLKDLYQTAFAAILILIFNLIIHVTIRSLWIGALGLRYVSGEVNIDRLNYSERFSNFLKKKVGSFDNYIEILEKLCSIIFAISFLLIFYIAGAFIVLHLINLIGLLEPENASPFLRIVINTLQIIFIAGAVLTFVDYLTQGLLKKNKRISAIYFPIYRLFSYLTLSFLYRPLYYNLIDNKFGRIVNIVLLPFYIVVLIITNTYKEPSQYIGLYSMQSSSIKANERNYEDLLEKDYNISALAIQSKVICDPYIKIKVPLTDALEERILRFNESLKAYYDNSGYSSFINIGNSPLEFDRDSIHLEYLRTFERIYTLKIDSITYKPSFVIISDNDRLAFETYIGTSNLAEGKHMLYYSRFKHAATDSLVTIREIPFWYFKD